MPSAAAAAAAAAATVKLDKQVSSSDSTLVGDNNNNSPLRQAITAMEHKIRNLEKRKSKLESYRDLQNAGKELHADQKTAVAKYNEVIHTLDFAKDMCKQFLGIAIGSEKEAKKLVKKEAAAKTQAELARLREILLVQDALHQMGTEAVREDFLYGRNGAAQLSEADLKLLDDLYPVIIPRHESGNPTAFTNEVQTAAEHLLAVVDGKQKEIFGSTYSQIKEVLGKIHESGYFDQAPNYENDNFAVGVESSEITSTTTITTTTNDPSNSNINNNAELMLRGEQIPPPVLTTNDTNLLLNHHRDNIIIPSTTSTTDMALTSIQTVPLPVPQLVEQQQIIPTATAAFVEVINQSILPPQPQLLVVEQQQQQPLLDQQQLEHQQQPIYYQPQQQQQPRPITEMLGTGTFFFLQESEIDVTPPEQIPSQTFTNQSFVLGGPQQQQQQIPHQLYQQQLPPQQQQQQSIPIVNNINNNNNNGMLIDDGLQQKSLLLDEATTTTTLQQNNNNNIKSNHRSSTTKSSNNNYYQNNNGYNNNNNNNNNNNSNRPRQVRTSGTGGVRQQTTVGNRHHNNN